ncbi:MAG: DUF3152 domain-containing protein [Bifidobacteriaceae bacterium]|nr:DUF3152 domain-containing protein [Bifidobacteriaceae bacterium]
MPPAIWTVTYAVETRGEVSMTAERFAQSAAAIFGNPCGWARGGIAFEPVESDAELRLVLAHPDEVAAAAEDCSAEYSCRVRDDVLINDLRWQEATELWSGSGFGIGAYRHMAVNHEVGHFLGLGHAECPEAGAPAPLMQQQSKDLGGCTFNPWPLPDEITGVGGAEPPAAP